MAGALQVRAQILMIEDFSVVNDPLAAVFIRDRLPAGSQIDYAEAAMPEMSPGVFEKSAVIGSAMANDLGHPPHDGAGG
jgi:hypothetical protein